MKLGRILRYAQIVAVALLVMANPLVVTADPAAPRSRHCVVAAEHHRSAEAACAQQIACCSTVHCCPILPEPAVLAAPRFEPGPHEDIPSAPRALLLIRAIDPPPRSPQD